MFKEKNPCPTTPTRARDPNRINSNTSMSWLQSAPISSVEKPKDVFLDRRSKPNFCASKGFMLIQNAQQKVLVKRTRMRDTEESMFLLRLLQDNAWLGGVMPGHCKFDILVNLPGCVTSS